MHIKSSAGIRHQVRVKAYLPLGKEEEEEAIHVFMCDSGLPFY
jgi:hypothetical protein